MFIKYEIFTNHRSNPKYAMETAFNLLYSIYLLLSVQKSSIRTEYWRHLSPKQFF